MNSPVKFAATTLNTTPLQRNSPRILLELIRPKQWIKNAFVFIGIIFSKGWLDWDLLLQSVFAALAFSFIASSVYIFNDLIDRERDRLHPAKCKRPLASGAVTLGPAVVLLLILISLGFAIGFRVSSVLGGILLVYVLQNIAYSKLLKQIVILDVFSIAFGFILRILAGTWGIGIEPSRWLLLSGLMIALFLGFGKRLAELKLNDSVSFRPVLDSYTLDLLNHLLGITAGGVIMAYSLYTVDPGTIALHHTPNLIYTVPLVIYGIFRYLYLIHTGKGGDPTKLVLGDHHIILSVILWLASVFWLLP